MQDYYRELGMNEACFENSKEKHKRHALMMTGRKDSEYTKKKKSKKARKKTVVIDICRK